MKNLVFLLSATSAAVLVGVSASLMPQATRRRRLPPSRHKLIAATSADEAMTFQDEKEIVLYDYAMPLQYVGGKAVRADFEKFFGSAKNIKGDFVSLHVVADGNVGVAYSIQHFTWTDKDGKPGEGTFRVTDGWHKVKDQWKLFHTHVSFPLNPESGKAEMNLKE